MMNVDQATGLCGGVVVARVLKSPSDWSRLKCGIFPSSIRRLRMTGSMPSMPRMISLRAEFEPGVAFR